MIKFIADIGSNHNGDFERCLKLIDTAIELECWGVKIQCFNSENLYASGYCKDPQFLKSCETPLSWIPLLIDYCHNNKINFGITPFDIQIVSYIKSLDNYSKLNFWKISSFDISRLDLMQECTDKPLFVSLGLASFEDYENLRKMGLDMSYDIVYLHCCSEYPSPLEHCNLYNIKQLSQHYGFNCGWSDHSSTSEVIYSVIALGAWWIEFHLDLEDRQGNEYKFEHCWTPTKIKQVIAMSQILEKAIYSTGVGARFIENRKMRADPTDGMRPMIEARVSKDFTTPLKYTNPIPHPKEYKFLYKTPNEISSKYQYLYVGTESEFKKDFDVYCIDKGWNYWEVYEVTHSLKKIPLNYLNADKLSEDLSELKKILEILTSFYLRNRDKEKRDTEEKQNAKTV